MYLRKDNFDIIKYQEPMLDSITFLVEDMIAPTVSILNKKGYTTTLSCCGHPTAKTYNLTSYTNEHDHIVLKFMEETTKPKIFILFKEALPDNIELPPYFRKEYRGLLLCAELDTSEYYTELSTILDLNKKLYYWSLNLDNK